MAGCKTTKYQPSYNESEQKGKKKVVLVVFGTRPEAIKMCPLVKELELRPEFDCVVCVSGQHREMLDQVLSAFSVEPDFDLSTMMSKQSLAYITSSVLAGIDKVLEEVAPDIVLVHGDTTTSLSAALAAFYRNIPIGHVEAGLRTWNLAAPFPEELNRQVVDKVSRYHFAPTEWSKQNLIAEKISPDNIFVTGNTGIDALRTTVKDRYSHALLEWLGSSRLLLITAHRRENLGDSMRHMFRAIRAVVDNNIDVKAIYPVHPNPLVRSVASEELAGCDRIRLVEPLDIIDFHNILARSYVVLTDSGGIQEEAPYLGKPVLVMRDTTERPEGVAAGTLKLVGTDEGGIISATTTLLNDGLAYSSMANASNPYGDGFASRRIAEILSAAEI